MVYKVEAWSERGVSTMEAPTKRQANLTAERLRGDGNIRQTVVIKPNGDVRVCRNTKAKSA